MQTISIGYLCYRQQDWLDELNLSDGAKLLYGKIIRKSRGKAFAFPADHLLLPKKGDKEKHIRTLQRYKKELRETCLLATGKIRTEQTERDGYAILAHPDLARWTERLKERLKREIRVVVQDFDGLFFPSKVSQKAIKMSQKTTKMSPPSNYMKGGEVSTAPPCPPEGERRLRGE